MYSQQPEYGEVFKRIHQMYFPALKYFAIGKTGDCDKADMIVTDVFEKVFFKKIDLRDEAGIVKLLYHMTRHACIDHLRSKASEKKRIDQFLRDIGDDPGSEDRTDDRLETEAELMRRWPMVLLEVEKLPEKSRDTIRKLYLEGMSAKDLAKLRGIRVTSVHNLKNHALALLQKRLNSHENFR